MLQTPLLFSRLHPFLDENGEGSYKFIIENDFALSFLGSILRYDEGSMAKSKVVPVTWCICELPSSTRKVYFPAGVASDTCNVKTEVTVSFDSKIIGLTVNVELNSSSLVAAESKGSLS